MNSDATDRWFSGLADKNLAALLRAPMCNLKDAAYWQAAADYLEESGEPLAGFAVAYRAEADRIIQGASRGP